MENVADFLKDIDNNLTYCEIPTQLACAYLKGHLAGRALDWFEVLGSRVEEDKASDYAHLKQAFTEQFPVDRNRTELEIRFYSSSQKHNKKPSDFAKGFEVERSGVRVGNSEIQTKARTIVPLTGIGRKIGGRQEVTTDTRTIADRGGSSIDLRVKVLRRIGDSMVDAKVVNLIIDSIIKAVDEVVRGTVLSGEGTVHPIQSLYASPVVLTRKNNGLPPDSPEAYRFAIDYRKLNAITKYPRYPLPVIDDLITNIPHTGIISTSDLKSGYFQLVISPKDMEKIAFITGNGTFAFLRMPFGLSGVAPNFQKAIDIILKQVIGRFVMVYMDDVIITSPSFNEHIDHLNQVFTLLRDAGLTLNKDKCHSARDKLKYLGLIISKEGIEPDNTLRALALNSREQLIREQREDPELGDIYRYLENPDDASVNATVCDNSRPRISNL
ncbi:retrovirus-related Pol polyprotein from transposon 297 [Trichonephila clavipes]|nr:retrovirus-related Pol polyprotein from transposon 297 [Trichonephila clavipes]